MPRNLGGKERAPDERDFLLGSIQAPIQIPASYVPDMTWFVRNTQGQQPACGAHGAAHFQMILEHENTPSVNQRYSARYSWIKIKQFDGFPLDAGTDLRSVFKSLQQNGADDFEPLGNDVTLSLTEYANPSAITGAMDASAANQKISSYAFGGTVFQDICQHIYKNKAVCILIKCDDGFWGTETPTFTQPLYGHFVVGYGYDENYIYIVDSADPQFGFKKLAKQYFPSKFVFESGTAIDIPPAQLQQIIKQSQAVVNLIPSAPLPVQEKLDILTAILNFLQSFFPKVVGSTSQPMSYNIFKSRTFWTLVATFVYNVWQLAAPSVPAQYSSLIDFVLTSVAAYFHLQTGVSTTGTN
jgi:hypothetical protein